MVRYLRFRLGLAILFYAAYSIQLTPVYGQKIEKENKTENFNDEYVFYQGVQGKPGVDFPVLSHIPKTAFTCRNMESGYYADLDTDCQVFHICEDNKKISFLCPNGTIFQQSELICEWWFKVNCTNSPSLYEESAEQLREDNARRKLSRRVQQNQHGAVMRMEEQSSVSASQNGRNYNIVQHQQKVSSKRVHNTNNNQITNYATANVNEKESQQRNNNNNRQNNQKVTLQVSNNNRQEAGTVRNHRQRKTNRNGPKQQTNFKEAQIQDSGDELVQFNVVTPRVQYSATPSKKNHFTETLRQTQANSNVRQNQPTQTTPNVNSVQENNVEKFKNKYQNEATTQFNYYQSKTEDFSTTTTEPTRTTSNNQFVTTLKPVKNLNDGKQTNIKQESTVSLTRNDIVNSRLEPSDSLESQIPQETGSFYKNTFNQIDNQYKTTTIIPANHRETYGEIKDPKYYSTKIVSAISSVTPQYLTTQPLNNGRPFIGSQVGNVITTLIPPNNNLFNVGITGKPLPVVTTTTTQAPVSNSLPNGLFNVGKTTFKTTLPPITTVKNNYISVTTTVEPISTTSKVDHATVYGRFVTPQPVTKSSSTPTNNPNKITNDEKNTNSIVYSSPSKIFTTLSSFYVTKKPESLNHSPSEEVQKPRPFQLPPFEPTTLEVTPTIPPYKISSASPFTSAPTTQPTPLSTQSSAKIPSTFENIDSMINALAAMANSQDHSGESPRPGLVIPPSAGPQTLHTLAQYFANALDGIAEGKDEDPNTTTTSTTLSEQDIEKKKLTALLTQMTMNRYNELFNEDSDLSVTTTKSTPLGGDDLEAQHSKSAVQSPKVRQLAKVFTQALSSYLDDPVTFKRVLEEVRPTEPPQQQVQQSSSDDMNDDELLNFSDADSKSSYPPIFPTAPSVRPTWGYIIAYNTSQQQNFDGVKNSLSPETENLQLADSQSFVSQFNKLHQNDKKTTSVTESNAPQLPTDHWTSSPGVHKLWKTAFSFDPASINENFDVTTESTPITTTEENVEDENSTDEPFRIKVEPENEHEIQYELRALPKLALNSTQVHGILIDFMNTTSKQDETNRLNRILRKLNTTQDEFLEKMREIERNPLTRRLILLLISECGANATKEIQTQAVPIHTLLTRKIQENQNRELLETASSGASSLHHQQPEKKLNSFKEIQDLTSDDDNQDARALQLLNSLYSIASRFGK